MISDLTVTDWTPIGSATTPFNGKFDGGGHTIYGLTGSGNIGGLFGYNKGYIKNLIIDGWNYTYSCNRANWDYTSGDLHYAKEDIFAGAICAVNDGIIEKCKLIGSIGITCTTSNSLGVKNPFPTGSANYEISVGGIAGKNIKTVKDCSTGGNASFNYSNTVEYCVDRNVFTGMAFGAGYKVFRNKMTVHTGWIVGYNVGTAADCVSVTNGSYSVTVKATQDGFGHAVAENILDIGGAIGLNTGTVTNVNSKSVSVNPVQNLSATPPWNANVGEYCNAFNEMTLNVGASYNGIVGNNISGGKIS